MIKKCVVCDCDIKTKEEIIKEGSKRKSLQFSDEGVFFEEDKVWFCNKDWNEIIENIFKGKKFGNGRY